jgi:hypothetical protein
LRRGSRVRAPLDDSLVALLHDAVEPVAARDRVVVQQLHAVDAPDGDEAVLLPLAGRSPVTRVNDVELAPQHLCEEVAVAARGLQKARVDALGLLLHHVEHGVDLALVGEHLAVLLHALS